MMHNPINDTANRRGDFFPDTPWDAPHTMPRRGRGGCGMGGGHDFGPGMRGGPGGRDFGPGGHGGPGFPGGFGGHGMPGGPGGHGMPPRRPNPEFLKRRVAEGDVMDLLDMAGRMAHALPQGGPARGQALILSILAGREALSQRELQQMLGIQPGSLSELISKLEAKGQLTREKAEDRRGNLLRITEAGRAALPAPGDAPEDDPLAPLSADQQDQLADLLRTLLTAWIDRLEPPRPFPHGDRPVQV